MFFIFSMTQVAGEGGNPFLSLKGKNGSETPLALMNGLDAARNGDEACKAEYNMSAADEVK